MIELSIARIRELFDYEPETGVLLHRRRARSDFSAERFWRAWNARYAGKPAGSKSKGYLVVCFRENGERRRISVHRLIWVLVHGRWPSVEIDHRDGDRANNELKNLREATHAENCQNTPSSLTKGTVFDAATIRLRRRFRAFIKVDGKQRWLGAFATRDEAHAAYLAAKATLHTFQPVPRGN
jgi:hypothetical protein